MRSVNDASRARARSAMRTSRQRLDAYTRSLIEHGTETTERDISWLDRLIANEKHQKSEMNEMNDEQEGTTP